MSTLDRGLLDRTSIIRHNRSITYSSILVPTKRAATTTPYSSKLVPLIGATTTSKALLRTFTSG